MKKILIIDDHPMHRLLCRRWIESLCPDQFEIIEAGTAEDGFEKLVAEAPDCVLLDYIMTGADGFQSLFKMKHELPDCPPVIFLTCALTEELKRNALALGAAACFDKSALDAPALVGAITAAVGSTTQENAT